MDSMSLFLQDYEKERSEERYREAALPELPFKNKEFDLALCSHYLFLYSDQVSLTEHMLSVRELCRVCKEIRIYPLVTLLSICSVWLEPVTEELKRLNIPFKLQSVTCRFQKGADKMLVITPGDSF